MPVAVGQKFRARNSSVGSTRLLLLSERGKPSEVDASDGVISVLKGAWSDEDEPFAEVGTDHGWAVAGAVEYQLAAEVKHCSEQLGNITAECQRVQTYLRSNAVATRRAERRYRDMIKGAGIH